MTAVSIILNSYNQAKYLPAAIDSVLAQSFADFELIIIDNGSTDSSQSVIRSYKDPRIRIFLYSTNEPITKRFNEGVKQACGDFLSFLYSDDLYLPDKLAIQLARFGELDASYGMVYSPAVGRNELTGVEWSRPSVDVTGWSFDALIDHFFDGFPDMISPMTRRSCLSMHPFNEAIFAEGEAVFLRVALTHQFAYIDRPLVITRDHGANAGKAVRKNSEMTLAALQALENHALLPASSGKRVRRLRARVLVACAWQGARLGESPLWVLVCVIRGLGISARSVARLRTVGALCLIAIPLPLRRHANRLVSLMRDQPSNDTLVECFGGSADAPRD